MAETAIQAEIFSQRQGRPFYRIRHSRDDAPGHAARCRESIAGLSRFSGSGRDQTRGAGSHCRRHQSICHHLGSKESSRRDCPPDAVVAGLQVDPEREITVCCGSTETMISTLLAVCNAGRRSGHLRAFLRKLRAGRDSFRSQAAICELRPPRRARRRVDLR